MINVFVSYSHVNEDFLTQNLLPMLENLKKKCVLDYFYDRKLRPDGGLFETIDFKINECDIAIILLSKDYYLSESCRREKENLLKRKLLEGIYFLPMVISDCEWIKDDSIKNNLFLNTDAKCMELLSSEELKSEITNIETRIQNIANDIEIIKTITYNDSFLDFLQDMDVLKTSHRSKNTLLLSDVFIYPTLRKFVLDDDKNDEISSDKIFEDSKNERFVFISGDDVSGKTSLLKKYVMRLKENNFIPLYFNSDDNFDGHIFNILAKKFFKQINSKISEEKVKQLLEDNKERIVIFIDDFHKIHNKKKIVEKLNLFKKVICTVDLIYSIDYEIKGIKDITAKYSIKELSPKQRNEIIQKWLMLDEETRNSTELVKFKQIEKKAQEIEVITGKSLNGGIMPAYPFLVLSVLSNVETLNRPLNQQISSYGYCYEALITIAFTKCGLRTDAEIGGSINFLSLFAYKLFQSESFEMSTTDFELFLNDYEKQISLPLKRDKFIQKLQESRLLIQTTIGNYRFDYKYIYYYFIAKYFSDTVPDSLAEIEKICKNIHKDENAYIIIFFSHNTKSNAFYDILLKEADSICKSVQPATLKKKDMSFFNDSYQELLNIVLPNKTHNYKTERVKQLEVKQEKEYSPMEDAETEEINDEQVINLRKSIKLTEAMGLIVKNRFTSIERTKVRKVLQSAIDLNLRELESFFNLFKNPENQTEIINFINDAVKREMKKENKTDDESCKQIASNLFWEINFVYVFVIVLKTIYSIGSEKLIPFFSDIANQNPTPANHLILEGSKIVYGKNIDKTVVFKHIKDSNFSDVAKSILKIFVIECCRTNPTDFSEIQKISSKMHIPIEKLKQ